MIVQAASQGHPHFIIQQADHARTSGQLAAAFGNGTFAPLAPAEPVVYVSGHHDEGWVGVDGNARFDPATRLPYHLTATPMDQLIETGSASPDFNEAHHPYSGLLSSLHTYGLYHGRYGLSDMVFIDRVDPAYKDQAEAMLAHELARQERLKADLRAESDLAPLAEENVIFHNYKLLQFFDTLALYFHLKHAGHREEATFINVPRGIDDDVSLTISPHDDGSYRLTPWPFAGSDLTVSVEGRMMAPYPADSTPDDVAADLRNLTATTQRYHMVAG